MRAQPRRVCVLSFAAVPALSQLASLCLCREGAFRAGFARADALLPAPRDERDGVLDAHLPGRGLPERHRRIRHGGSGRRPREDPRARLETRNAYD